MARIPRRLAVLAAATLLGLSTLDPPAAHAAPAATFDGARIPQPVEGFGFYPLP